MLSLSRTQARLVQGKELIPLFHLICLLPNLAAGLPAHCQAAGWGTRVNPLPCPLLSVRWIPSLSGSQSTAEERTPGWLGREGKLSPCLAHSHLPQSWPMKRNIRRKRTKAGLKKAGEGEKGNLRGAAKAQHAGWRELHRAGKEAFCLVTVPPEAQRLKIKTGTSFHVCVQRLMLVL